MFRRLLLPFIVPVANVDATTQFIQFFALTFSVTIAACEVDEVLDGGSKCIVGGHYEVDSCDCRQCPSAGLEPAVANVFLVGILGTSFLQCMRCTWRGAGAGRARRFPEGRARLGGHSLSRLRLLMVFCLPCFKEDCFSSDSCRSL